MKKLLLFVSVFVSTTYGMWTNSDAIRAIKAAANNPAAQVTVAKRLVAWEVAAKAAVPPVVQREWAKISKEDFHKVAGGGGAKGCPQAVADAQAHDLPIGKTAKEYQAAIDYVTNLKKNQDCSSDDQSAIDTVIRSLTTKRDNAGGGGDPKKVIEGLVQQAQTLRQEIKANAGEYTADVQALLNAI